MPFTVEPEDSSEVLVDISVELVEVVPKVPPVGVPEPEYLVPLAGATPMPNHNAGF